MRSERGDAGGTQLRTGARVRQMQLDAVAIARMDEDADRILAGIVGEYGDERIEPAPVILTVTGLVQVEAQDGAVASTSLGRSPLRHGGLAGGEGGQEAPVSSVARREALPAVVGAASRFAELAAPEPLPPPLEPARGVRGASAFLAVERTCSRSTFVTPTPAAVRTAPVSHSGTAKRSWRTEPSAACTSEPAGRRR